MKKLKISLVALTVSLFLFGGSAYASFPAKKEKATEQTTNVSNTVSPSTSAVAMQEKVSTDETTITTAKPAGMDTDMLITLALWFFLGGVAAHRWYKGKPVGWNILYIITLGGCGIWAIIDLINILTGKF